MLKCRWRLSGFCCRKIDLIEDVEKLHAFSQSGKNKRQCFFFFPGLRLIGASKQKHNVGIFNRLQRAFNADTLNLVVGVTDASRIDQIDSQTVQVNRVSDAVSCGARNVGDDSDIVAGQSIHKRALANVRSAGENNRETLAKNLTSHSCVLQLHELCEIVVTRSLT